MAPEQVGGNEYNEKCDIWALGCVIYEMASLSVPFKAENYLQLATVITELEMPDIPSRYSDKLANIIKIMTHKDPKLRPTAIKLLECPEINSQLASINYKKRLILKQQKEQLDKKNRELLEKEQKLRKQYRELEKLKNQCNDKLKQIEEHKYTAPQKNSRNETMNYNTEATRTFERKYELNRMNRTIDQYQDMSNMYSSQDKQIENSVRYHNRLSEGGNADNIENINTSNSNLTSSNSSQNRKNYALRTSNDSKKLSGSNNFDDSNNELSRSKTRMQKHFKEYTSKKVSLNLYSDGNSSGSMDVNISKGNASNQSNEKINNIIQSLGSGPTAASTLASKVDSALKKHIINKSKDRSFDSNRQTPIGMGLPPSGQNLVQKSVNIEKGSYSDLVKTSQEIKWNTLKRNISSNHLGQMAENEDGSRNRHGNRVSIPTTFRGETIESFKELGSKIQNVDKRQRDDLSNNSRGEKKMDFQLPLRKADSDNSTKPPRKNPGNNFTFNNYMQKNPIL